ncbi:MAG: SIS domain-containing protein [Clostridia bacterium]|nr:SIS domain-containing protein [Clostridia bacterium]
MDYKTTLMWKEISETGRIFNEIAAANEAVMASAVKAIKASGATNFVLAGRGTSDHALMYFKYVLEEKTGYTASYAAPSIVTVFNGKLNYKHSVVVGCSQSGKAADALAVLEKANREGAVTIAITNDETSPMAKEAKYHLYCNCGPEKSVAATKTFSAQLYLSLWLANEIAGDKNETEKLHGYYNCINALFPTISELTDKYSAKYKNTFSGFVLSRGITYAIANEQTLKLQETCYIQMKGYACSDFYHGPMAMVNDKTPVLVYCAHNTDAASSEKLMREDQEKCIDKMLSLGAPVLVITDDKYISEKYAEKTDVAYIPADGGDRFSIFSFALFAQMLACKISVAIGNNPDAPRALKKITITK